MQVANNMVVAFNYTLTDREGTVIDSSEGREPLAYIHGTGSIIRGLEDALEGKGEGDRLEVTIEPADAYGERSDDLRQAVPRDRFEDADSIVAGMQFHTYDESGGVQIVTVIEVASDVITIDANHPLAGETLNFDVTVVEVREASAEELEHGHVHGPDGHHHDH